MIMNNEAGWQPGRPMYLNQIRRFMQFGTKDRKRPRHLYLNGGKARMAHCVFCYRVTHTTNAPCAACVAELSWEPNAEVSWDTDVEVRADCQAPGRKSSQVELPPTLLGLGLPSLPPAVCVACQVSCSTP